MPVVFFFQAEDGIRDADVTGVQTCALPICIVTTADLRDEDQYAPVSRLMSKEMVTITAGMSNRDAFLVMEHARVKAVPVLDDHGRLHGVLTRDDAVRLDLMSPSLDARGKLMVACAIGIS